MILPPSQMPFNQISFYDFDIWFYTKTSFWTVMAEVHFVVLYYRNTSSFYTSFVFTKTNKSAYVFHFSLLNFNSSHVRNYRPANTTYISNMKQEPLRLEFAEQMSRADEWNSCQGNLWIGLQYLCTLVLSKYVLK